MNADQATESAQERVYVGRHRRQKNEDDRAAEARAAGLCSWCEGSKRDNVFGGSCRYCGGVGTASAETDVVLDSILADLRVSDV